MRFLTSLLAVTALAKEKPRYPVRVGAGFWASGVDGLVVNRAEHPLQHAMPSSPLQLCWVTGRAAVGDFCEVLPFQHNRPGTSPPTA